MSGEPRKRQMEKAIMDREQVRAHWRDWASKFGTALGATTRTGTAKMLEIDALARRMSAIGLGDAPAHVLEVGCGNGLNCFGLAAQFPRMQLDGIDYTAEMIDAAREAAVANGFQDRSSFRIGNALELSAASGLLAQYDVVFTDRCLINIESVELQMRAITDLAARVREGGHLIMIENSMATYDRQNHCRTLLDMPARTPAEFNLFFDETRILPHLKTLGFEVEIEDFISLHDLMLYVLVPAINGGTVDYDHPLVHAATQLSIAVSAEISSAFGAFGQGRMFVCRKP
ncbi:Methyltransferase type 11 [Nitrobacter hamburgensis X14]|uniref:Methyltransferase type 11 n=2 Tax=Nitrobacter hamburgensis TaxID=912 RepID=Q1QP16_NITHX|nr:Methyltransferase type 11 [Nitrobacter hamburgensis X14]